MAYQQYDPILKAELAHPPTHYSFPVSVENVDSTTQPPPPPPPPVYHPRRLIYTRKPLPPRLVIVQTCSAILLACLAIAYAAYNGWKVFTSAPLVKSSYRVGELDIPEAIFCANPGANYTAFTDFSLFGRPNCIGMLGRPGTDRVPISLAQYIKPVSSLTDFTVLGTPDNYNISCHQFSPNGALKWTILNDKSANDEFHYTEVLCGYDYIPLWNIDRFQKADQMIVYLFDKTSDRKDLASPDMLVIGTTVKEFTIAQSTVIDLPPNDIPTPQFDARPGRTYEIDDAGNPIGNWRNPGAVASVRHPGLNYTLYFSMLNGNTLTKNGYPNIYRREEIRFVPSFTWIDWLGAVGGFVAIPLTLYTVLFGARKQGAFGLVHRFGFRDEVVETMRGEYGGLPYADRGRGREGLSVDERLRILERNERFLGDFYVDGVKGR